LGTVDALAVFPATSGQFNSIHEMHPPQVLMMLSLLSKILQRIAKQQHFKAM
jgi:hypothetical protein